MLKYKLTTQNNTTFKNTKWEIGKPIETDGKIKELCTKSWLHFYHTPELAILMNPSHANIINPRLYEVEVEGEILDNDYGLKAGCTKMTLIREVEKPVFTNNELVSIGLEFTKYCFEYNDEKTKPLAQKCIDLVEKWLIDSNFVTVQDLLDASYAASNDASYASYAASYTVNAASYTVNTASYTVNTASYVSYAVCYISSCIYYSTTVTKNTNYIKLQEIILKGIQNAKI